MAAAYIRAILRQRAQPNPLTWLLWSITPAITFVVALLANDRSSLVVTGALALSPFLVFATAVVKNLKLLRFDRLNLACGGLAIVGIVLWRLSNVPELAIIIAILADLTSSIPTLLKTQREPFSEYAPTYIMSSSAMLIALLTIPHWTFVNSAYIIYVFVLNLIIANLTSLGRLRQLG